MLMLCIGKEETGTRYRVPVSLKTARSDCLVDLLHGHLFGEAQIFQGTPITDIISVIQGTGHLYKGTQNRHVHAKTLRHGQGEGAAAAAILV